jgi:hypothetical protein
MSRGADHVKAFRKRRRAAALASLGGICVGCEATEKLDFDHVDPATKLFDISSGLQKRADIFWAEVAKCQLLCRPCHLDKSQRNGELRNRPKPLPHGTESGYLWHKCRCALCKAAGAAAQARRRAALKAGPVPHGTESGYSWHRCRCARCKAAAAAAQARRRAARKVGPERRTGTRLLTGRPRKGPAGSSPAPSADGGFT